MLEKAEARNIGWTRRGLVSIINIYSRFISPCLGARCRFYPSCSEYAVEAILTFPIFVAIGKIIWRLLRCAPWGKGGVDPVVAPKKSKEML